MFDFLFSLTGVGDIFCAHVTCHLFFKSLICERVFTFTLKNQAFMTGSSFDGKDPCA